MPFFSLASQAGVITPTCTSYFHCLLACLLAQAGPTLYEVDGQVPFSAFGSVITDIDDVNGDGMGDLAVSSWANPSAQVAGQVSVISGADSSVLYTVFGASAQDRFGSELAMIPTSMATASMNSQWVLSLPTT